MSTACSLVAVPVSASRIAGTVRRTQTLREGATRLTSSAIQSGSSRLSNIVGRHSGALGCLRLIGLVSSIVTAHAALTVAL